MWSDESSFMLFPTSGEVYVWTPPKETCNPECLVPTLKHGARSVLIWAAISSILLLPVLTLNGCITVSDYVDILHSQGHPMVQMLCPNNDAIFQDDSSPKHTARSVQSWFQEHEDALQHLLWLAQSSSSSSSVICQTTGPKPLPKRFLHTVRSRASSFN